MCAILVGAMARCSRGHGSTEETTTEFTTNGCFIVLWSFSSVVVWGGVYKSLGVLLPTLTDQFTDHVWMIGIALSAMGLSCNITALLCPLLKDAFGIRRTIIVSTLLTGVGLALVPLAASSILDIAIILAVVVGPTMAINTTLSKVMLGRHFKKQYTLASGINHTGQVLSLLAFAPMTQLFLDTYGWRGATLLLAGVCFHPLICAMLVKTNKSEYELPVDQNDLQEPNCTRKICSDSCFASVCSSLDLRIILQFNFWVLCSCLTAVHFVDTSWFLFYQSHLQAKGFSPQASASICSAGGGGYFLGCFLFAPLVDRGRLKCSTAVILSSLGVSLSLIADPWLTDTVTLTLATVFFSICIAAMYTLTDVLTKDLLGRDRLTSAFTWILFFGVVDRLLSAFLPGLIYEKSGSYELAFTIMGITPAVAVIPLVIVKLRKQI